MVTPAEFNARRAALAEEISAATGCDLRIAGIAAGSYLTFPNDRMFGLGDPSPGMAFDFSNAFAALRGWLETVDQRKAA